ncbi:hypothetical protein BGW38_001373 [Lunasporangiospora selenospora]|uniref:RRM domain-containing protein n=1 Tax=Lunasporangiospora selenospora TaxID=979761 RepID=A0A9P6KIC0_9FUNG|nr:hypothetical protein BGW38_001373 [Lunasporangiospora selenospora]
MTDKYEIDLSVRPGDDLQDEEMAETPEVTVKRKGRGFRSGDQRGEDTQGSVFTRLSTTEDTTSGKAMKSVEGWIVLITGVHEEATEDDVNDKFGDFGEIKSIHLNLDRRTGYVKARYPGYALVEYETLSEAQEAINQMNGAKLLDQTLACDFAFIKSNSSSADDRGRRGFTPRNKGNNTGRRTGHSNSPSRH